MSGGEYDHNVLLRSTSSASEGDLESQSPRRTNTRSFKDLLKRLDRGFSGRRSCDIKRSDRDQNSSSSPSSNRGVSDEILGDSAPPEWAMLLVGCLLGLATGLCVAAFNRGVHVIHEWAWAGTPNDGAAWLRLQRLADTWHRILLIPVLGGVIVGMLHGLLEILDQITQSSSSQGQGFDLIAGIFPTVKAIQAAITLGTGCSLGPEGPSVDIGKSCAYGCSVMMENNRERRIALIAAGAAAGIASGFNAAVAGSFFAIETVLRPLRAENSPPFTTAMIILASVISSTVSNAVLGEKQAFTVPTYDMKSAAELPLYLILGMLCGVVSVAFTRLVSWFTKGFQFLKEKFGLSDVVCPALGGLGAGVIALRYPGILYWGFTNVDEILHTGKTASAPGIGLLAQLVAAKVVATALCKGSGLVGGLYAPSLMIGAAVGAVFGGLAGELINSAIPGNAAIAQPQAYALVGMAATLASVCSVPLTSVLLLFELTKDYRILLPLMGAVGLAIWVPSVTDQPKETDVSEAKFASKGYSILSPVEKNEGNVPRKSGEGNDLELLVIGSHNSRESFDEGLILEDLKVSQAMSNDYLKVSPSQNVKEALECMHDGQQSCVIVVGAEGYLEGILTYADVKRSLFKSHGDSSNSDLSVTDANTCLVSSICTRGISYRGQDCGLLTCYPDTDLATAKQLMEAKGIKQLPVVKRGGEFRRERKRRIIAILRYDSIEESIRSEVSRRKSVYQQSEEDNDKHIVTNGH
ncbi:chloride channel protein CLC-f isoform X2 [Nicotiana tabacum]|uniref:Chloride channel protein n=2 Tax=Nicotiana TaxID=4085 RepID=A0A1S3X2R5_TOBAC|nr:PREDICTED: chloride channel protein CLC-f-like isoform X1 [Nicotiana sylvestris]XP_016433983.1 PREDICTED: chloride channel protein CLC-f-like isoform X2 [Nicotiana tabacum]